MSGFSLYFCGAEQQGWRTTLAAAGVRNVSASFWSLRKRRTRSLDDIEVSDWGFEGVLLDSGGFSANKRPGELSPAQWEAYAEEYLDFARTHVDALSLVTEFDSDVLGREWVVRMRERWADAVPADKFLPIWHPRQGVDTLSELGERYPRVAVHQEAVSAGGLNVTPHLNQLARRGTLLHGVAMTKPSVLRQVPFATAASTSWLSPSQYGDTIVWNNNQLMRYPQKMKAQARLRHRQLFADAGFDPDLIQADDKDEVTSLALWSWLRQEDAIRALRGALPARMDDRSNNERDAGPGDDASTTDGEVATIDPQTGSGDPRRSARREPDPVIPRDPGDIKTLPVLSTRTVQSMNTETREVEDLQVLEVRGTSVRQCNTCVVQDKCPEFKSQSTCAYSIPIEMKTAEQRKALLTGVAEMQIGRVAFLRMVEELNGGYADPNLSQEIDRLLKVLETQADLMEGREFLKISVEAKGKTGALSRLFGQAPPARSQDAAETDSILGRVIEGQRVT